MRAPLVSFGRLFLFSLFATALILVLLVALGGGSYLRRLRLADSPLLAVGNNPDAAASATAASAKKNRAPGDLFTRSLQPLSEQELQRSKALWSAADQARPAGKASRGKPRPAPPATNMTAIYGAPLAAAAGSGAAAPKEIGRVELKQPQALRGRVDLNQSPAEELAWLPGIGEKDALHILAYRAQHKEGIRRLGSLAEAGIAPPLQEVIRPLVEVEDLRPQPPEMQIEKHELQVPVDDPAGARRDEYLYQGTGQMTALEIADFSSPLSRPLRLFDSEGRLVASYAGALGTFRTVFVEGAQLRLEFDPTVSRFKIVYGLDWNPPGETAVSAESPPHP